MGMGVARWFHIILILSIFLFTAIRIHRSISYYLEEGYDEDAPPSLTRSATNDVEDSNKKKPLNILLLYADDWSYNTLGAMGNEYVQTPHLDELARQGVLFTHSCVVTSDFVLHTGMHNGQCESKKVCMQSRATLYTGQYSSRHKTLYMKRNITMYEPHRWNNTLYPLMKGAGYHVGFYGKYHHTTNWPIYPFSKGWLYYGDHLVTRDNVTRHVTEWNELDAIKFLEDRPRHEPFFLTVSFFATHAMDKGKKQYIPQNSSMSLYEEPAPIPKTMSERHWKDMPFFFNKDNFGRYRFRQRYNTPKMYQHHHKNMLRMATEVDRACASILDKLKDQNVLDNTLVIFTTDNGNFHGQHGLAEKWYAYEESLRVPLIIRDPRMPKDIVGSKNSEFVLNIDLAPTILSAAGMRVPDVMQGVDIAPLYLEKDAASEKWRKEFLYEFRDANHHIPNSMALVQKDFKYIYWEEYKYEQLFDLNADPYEEIDLRNHTDKKSLMLELHSKMQEYSNLIK